MSLIPFTNALAEFLKNYPDEPGMLTRERAAKSIRRALARSPNAHPHGTAAPADTVQGDVRPCVNLACCVHDGAGCRHGSDKAETCECRNDVSGKPDGKRPPGEPRWPDAPPDPPSGEAELHVEEWQCTCCGEPAPCRVQIVHTESLLSELNSTPRFSRIGCLCLAGKVPYWTRR